MKVIIYIFGLMALAVVLAYLGTAFNLITLPWLKFDQKVQTNQDIIKKTYNADNALYNYHWFKQQLEAIDATQKKIDDAYIALTDFEKAAGPRDKWTFEDKTEDARLRSVYQGLKSHHNDLAAEYNARAKSADQAIFNDQLPLYIGLQ